MVANAEAFAFVSELAGELNKGELDLPSFPDVALRVRNALEDEDCTVDTIARVVGSEPALAANLIKMSNSALMRRGDIEVKDLRTAINRLGRDNVRNASMSLAVQNMLSGDLSSRMKKQLDDLWKHSVRVAAVAYAVTKELTDLNPDEALLAGLLHDIGKLYILTRAEKHPELFENDEVLEDIMRDWHPAIGKAIIESWGLSEDLALAAETHEDVERTSYAPPDMGDLVLIANLLSHLNTGEGPQVEDWSTIPACERLGINPESSIELIKNSNEEIRALSQALGQ